ncbi:MAG: hypothetical protein FWD57_05520, partial [Polyangiaceae bacterium]|nr:hypothetical protein [Polyangiaceae bacterium]
KCWGVGFMDAYRGTGFNAPKHVLGITSGVEAVCAGGWYEDWRRAYWDQVCVLTAAGAVKCSRNQASGIGKPPDAGVVAISCGMTHACAIMATGGVECWGGNYSGELGDGTNNWKKGALRPVLGLEPGVTAISAGSNHTCAITAGGGLKCWGGNDSGQLGDGTSVQYKANPVTSVSGLESGVVSVSAGHGYTCAIASGGSVKCWGLNDKAQLGDGTKAVKKVPTQVVGLESGVVAISAGSRHACALSAAGGVWCWGTMMGGGTTVQKSTPAKIPGLESGVVGIAAGEEITCAITTGKRVMCWGYYYKAGGPYGKDAAYWNITPREQSGVL